MDTNVSKQLIYLVHQNTGIKLEKVIEQILSSNIYNTREIFHHPNIQELNQDQGGGQNKYYNTLELFTYSNYINYKQCPGNYLDIQQPALSKLKILTILDLAKEKKVLTFDELYVTLDIKDHFELDQLIFEAFSSGLISGKVDQFNKNFKILHIKGRDFIYDKNYLDSKFDKWINSLEYSEKHIENQILSLKKEKSESDIINN